MSKANKVDTKEIGLDIGLLFLKFFTKTEYLHYGYWPEGLEVDIIHLKEAQENYTKLLSDNIPPGVNTILDVGCGSGKVAQELIAAGYSVEAVSPSPKLSDHAKDLLGNSFVIYQGIYEDVVIEKTYDLVLFSESFQYINMQKAFENARRHLNPGGHILICDFFQTDAPGSSPLGGGHKLKEFYELLPSVPFETVKDQDITPYIAPTMKLVNDITLDLVQPVWKMLLEIASARFPFMSRLLLWWFKKKLDKLDNKHFKGERNPENFIKYKSYRLLVLKKK